MRRECGWAHPLLSTEHIVYTLPLSKVLHLILLLQSERHDYNIKTKFNLHQNDEGINFTIELFSPSFNEKIH